VSQQILPFYLLCDESGSMAGGPVDTINESVRQLNLEIGGNPGVAHKARFYLIGFSNVAEVLLPLSDMSAVGAVPALTACGGTDYEAAFRRLRRSIDDDVEALTRQGFEVCRPAVFFLSDGYASGTDWESAYQELTDTNWPPHPDILSFGFGMADESTIRRIATVRAFMANGWLGPAEALREFTQSLIRSIVYSGTQAATDAPRGAALVVPDRVPGFTTIPTDVVSG